MADQNLEFTLGINTVDAINHGKDGFDEIGDHAGKVFDDVGKKIHDNIYEMIAESNKAMKDLADAARKVSKESAGLESALTKSERFAAGMRVEMAGASDEMRELYAQFEKLHALQKAKPEVAKIREDRLATPAGQHNLVVDKITSDMERLRDVEKLTEAEKDSAIREQENQKRIQQEYSKTLESINRMEEKVKKYSDEHHEAFDRMRQEASELASKQAGTVGGSATGGKEAIEEQKALREQFVQNGEARLRDSRRISEAADAEKAAASTLSQQQEKLNAEYQKADDYLSEQAKSMRDMGSSGAQAAADIEQLRVELQELYDLKGNSAGGGGSGPGSPPDDDDLEALKKAHKYRLEVIKDEQKEAAKAHAAINQDHKERFEIAKKYAASQSELAASRYKEDKEYQSATARVFESYHKKIDALAINSSHLSSAMVEAELHAATSAKDVELRGIQEVAQAKKNKGFFDATGMNKANQAMYNIQQTIEDYSYAGLKGATNNLGFLANSIGGSAGVAAMFGVMTLNVLSTSGALREFSEWAGISTEKTKEQKEALDASIERFHALRDAQREAAVDWESVKPMELDGEALKEKIRLEEIANNKRLDEVSHLTKAVRLNELMVADAQKINDALSLRSAYHLDKLGMGGTMSPEELHENTQKWRDRNEGEYGFNMIGQSAGSDGAKVALETYEANEKLIASFESLSDQFFRTVPNAKLTADSVESMAAKLRDLNNAVAGSNVVTKEYNKELALSNVLRDAQKEQAVLSKADTFGTGADDNQHWKDRVDEVNRGVEGAGGKAYTEELKRQKEELQKQLDLIKKASDAETTRMQQAGKTAEEIKAAADSYSGKMVEENALSLEATEASRERAEAISDTVKKLTEAEGSLERQISDTERLIDTEKKHLASIEQAESARLDNEERRRNAAKDKIEDLRTSEKVEAIDKNLAGNKDWASNRKAEAENWANNNLNGQAKQNFQNQLNWEYDAYVKGLDNRAKADKEHAENQGNAAKQKNLDALKAKLGGKAQDEVQAAAADGAGGNFEKAQGHIDKARKALEELQRAQERVIGKGTVKQAEDAQKDMDATGRKLQALSEQEAALAKERQKQANEQVDELKGLLNEVIEKKVTASEIKLNDPEEANVLNGVIERLRDILVLKQQIQAVQAQGAAPGGGGAGVGGPQANAGNIINNNMVANMGGASPASVFAAMSAAAQNFSIQRA